MKRKLKVKFSGFHTERGPTLPELWAFIESSPEENYFFKMLAAKYDLEISETPDILFTLHNGAGAMDLRHFKYKCLKVFITVENAAPDLRMWDYSFSYAKTGDRIFQFPCFISRDEFERFRTARYSDKVMEWRNHPKSEFCNFVANRECLPGHKARMDFVKRLMAYKRVDCPGKSLHNMKVWKYEGGPDSIHQFMKSYKFTVAFENEISPDYVTEKIYNALLVGSIPIYRGSPRIAEYFNPESFINCADYDNFDEVIKRVIEVDNDESLYRKYTQAPPLLENSKLHASTPTAVGERLDKIVNSIGKTPVSEQSFHKLRIWCSLFPARAAYRIKKHSAPLLDFISRS